MSKFFLKSFICVAFLCASFAFAFSNYSSVYNIHAEESGADSIKISWVYDGLSTDKFEIYRSNKPFAKATDVDGTLIASVEGSIREYSDKVEDFHEYYYAILVKTSDGLDKIILPSMNATVTGVHKKFPKIEKQTIKSASAKEKIYTPDSIRDIPLPILDFMEENDAKKYKFSKEVIEKVATLSVRQGLNEEKYSSDTDLNASMHQANNVQSLADVRILEPYAFDQDLISPEVGEDYLLFDILHRTFAKKKYEDGVAQLSEFLSVNHSEQVTNRSYFYLGECLYFSGNFVDAIMSFMKVQEIYPDLSQKWIDSCLDLITISDVSN